MECCKVPSSVIKWTLNMYVFNTLIVIERKLKSNGVVKASLFNDNKQQT